MALKRPRSPADWALAAFVLFLLFTRFWVLGEKPYHHDESMHAVYSWQHMRSGNYVFNPMLHGPLLYHLQAAIFTILPVNDWTGRLAAALPGIWLGFFGLLLFKREQTTSRLIWLGLIAFSPTLCFFSRTLIMDSLMTALAVTFLIYLMRMKEEPAAQPLYIASAVFALMVCTKLNALFYAFAFGTFLIVYMEYLIHSGRVETERTLVSFRFIRLTWTEVEGSTFRFLRKYRWHWLGAFLLFAAIFCVLYSSFFRNPGGILDGLYRKMIPYWVKQHELQRIKGPFDYYFPILGTYELPLLLGIALMLLQALRKLPGKWEWISGFFALCAISYGVTHAHWDTWKMFFDKRLHLEAPGHLILLFAELAAWVLLLRHHFKRNEIFAAFCVHWAIVSLLLYSYAGEKVPWLTTNIILPWCVYLAAALSETFEDWMEHPRTHVAFGCFLALAMGWEGAISIRASIASPADPRERLVYTHSSRDMTDLATRIYHLSEVTGLGKKLPVQVVGDAGWPLYWYLRDYDGWFRYDLAPLERPAVIVTAWEKQAEVLPVLQGPYVVEKRKLREWWVPGTQDVTFTKLVRYYIFREVWSPTGAVNLAVYVRADLL